MPRPAVRETAQWRVDGDKKYCKQPNCRVVWGLSTGGTTIAKHYETRHPRFVLQNKKSEVSELDVNSTSTPSDEQSLSGSKRSHSDVGSVTSKSDPSKLSSVQMSLKQSFSFAVDKTFDEAAALFFASNHMAYNIADSPYFHEFLYISCSSFNCSFSESP
jgi:hypothetical protein